MIVGDEVPVTIDGKKVGTANVISDGTIEVTMYDPETALNIVRGTITGISLSNKGIGNIELV